LYVSAIGGHLLYPSQEEQRGMLKPPISIASSAKQFYSRGEFLLKSIKNGEACGKLINAWGGGIQFGNSRVDKSVGITT
jgi:hypothetical protein